MESENETLAISTPVVRHARPWCPPEVSRAAEESLSCVSSDWTALAIGLNEKGSFRPLFTPGDKPECEPQLGDE